jgi:soluble lytic murein transglycosylase-like protein
VDGDSETLKGIAGEARRMSGINYCLKYWPQIIRESRYHIGMDAPAHDFMGQIEIESNCNAGIIGITGDIGLGQFNPGTARWLQNKEKTLQEIAVKARPLNPAWSIRALILFDKYLYENVTCQDWHYAFRAYNGGLVQMNREIKRAGTCDYKAVNSRCRRKIIETTKGRLNLCQININYPYRVHAAGEKYQAVSAN